MKLVILGIISTLCLIFIPYWAGLLFTGSMVLQMIPIWVFGLVMIAIIVALIGLVRLTYAGICAKRMRKW